MKSLVFGIYGNNLEEIDFTRNLSLFTLNNKRNIKSYIFEKFSLFIFEGSTGVKLIETGKYFISISGEYYCKTEFNVEKNKSSDKQLFLDLINNVSGTFTVCLYNKESHNLFVSNDLFNVYPLFYRINSSVKMFSNEYQPLIVEEDEKLELSKKDIDYYFKYGFTYGGNTFLNKVKKTIIEETIHFTNDTVTIEKNKIFIPYTFSSYDECLERLYLSLKDAVANIFSWQSDLIVTITGGLDSRMILALTDESIRKKVNYVTFFMPPLDESNDKDVLIAKLLRDRYSLNHSVISFDEKTEDLDVEYFNKIRTDNNQVKITGQLGGELLSSILYENVLPSAALINKFFTYKMAKQHFKLSHKTLKIEIKNQNKKEFYFDKLTASFLTSIYNGTEGAWLFPWYNSLRYFSPFSNTNFLKVWFSIPEEYFFSQNKHIYFDLYSKYFPDFKEIPTNSFLQCLEENNFKYFELGVEPKKSKQSKSNMNLEYLTKKEGFVFISSKFKKKNYLSDRNNFQRLVDFCFWYDHYTSI